MALSEELVASVPTPCLVIDLDAVDHNIALADELLEDSNVGLRPHFKAHKCRPLLRRQLANRHRRGVTCQTSFEALTLAQAGFDDILVTNQIVDPCAASDLFGAARLAQVTTVIDSPAHIEVLRSAERHGVEIGVLVEIDVGMRRCGLRPGDPALIELGRAVAGTDHLTFQGLQAYEGHAVLVPDRGERAALTEVAASIAKAERARLASAGFDAIRVSGGGTGTIDLAVHNGALNEVQAGSYVLLDATYARLDLGFRQAVFCVATIISRRDSFSAVIDAGLKQLSEDAGFPVPTDPRLSVMGMSDEHCRLSVNPQARYEIGDRVTLIPSHIDPTMNLHDAAFVNVDGTLTMWPIDRRGVTTPTPDSS